METSNMQCCVTAHHKHAQTKNKTKQKKTKEKPYVSILFMYIL